MRLVEEHDVDAAVERPLVALDVGLDRLLREERTLGALDGDVNQREVGHRLRLAVLENLEVFLLQIANVVAARVGDEHVDLDIVDLNLEGRAGRTRRGLRCLGLASRGLSRSERRTRE